MKLEKAYSLQVKDMVTAEKADQLYQFGKIDSKYAFKCPDENCDAKITCANLDKATELRKRDPYFTFVSDHVDGCPIEQDIIKHKRSINHVDDLYSDEDEYHDNAVRLNLQPPSNQRPDDLLEGNGKKGNAKLADAGTESKRGKRKIQRSKNLSSMIDAYLSGENFTVQLPQIGLIDLKDLFIEIDGQDTGDFPDEMRIYYGKAWINKDDEDRWFTVRFDNKLICKELPESKRPSFLIGRKKIDAYNYGKFQWTHLEKIADNKPKQIFLLSDTAPHPSDKGPYINLWLERMEYLDYRSL